MSSDVVFFGAVEVMFEEGSKALPASIGALLACNLGLFSLVVTPIGMNVVIADRDERVCSERTNTLKQVLVQVGVAKVVRAKVDQDLEKVMPGMRRFAQLESTRRKEQGCG